VAVWPTDNGSRHQQSYTTLSSVSTEMRDHLPGYNLGM